MSTRVQVTTRVATAADLDAVVALRVALLREYGDHPIYGRLRDNPELRARPVFATQLDSGNETMFLAEIDGEVVGIIRCAESRASPLLSPSRYCYVSSAYVKPAHRRHGVLRQLIARVEEWCHERDLIEMRLHSVSANATAASSWDALGFAVVEQVRMRPVGAPASRARARDSDAGADTTHATRPRTRSSRETPIEPRP